MFNFSGSEMVFLLLLALIILGPEKLPEALRKFGQTYGEFKKATTGFQNELKTAFDEPMREMRSTADELRKAATFPLTTDLTPQAAEPVIGAVESEPASDPPETVEPEPVELVAVEPVAVEPVALSPFQSTDPVAAAPPIRPVRPAVTEPAIVEPAVAEPAAASPDAVASVPVILPPSASADAGDSPPLLPSSWTEPVLVPTPTPAAAPAPAPAPLPAAGWTQPVGPPAHHLPPPQRPATDSDAGSASA